MAKTEELELEDPTAELPAEDPKPEEIEEQPVVEDEPDAEEEAIDVPVVVQDYMPAMAKSWGDLSEQQQQAVLDDLARTIDAGEPAGEGGDAGDKGKPDKAPEPGQTARTEQAPAGAQEAPDGLTDDELKAIEDEFSAELALALRKLNARMAFAVDATLDVGERTLKLATDARDDVLSLRDERLLENALERHVAEFRGYARAQYDAVVQKAKDFKKARRVSDWDDAVSLAILKQTREPAGRASPKDKQAARQLAATLASGGRSSRRMPTAPSGPKSVRDIYLRKVRKDRVS